MEGNVMGWIMLTLCVLVVILYAVHFLRDRFSRTKTVKAVVVHKQPVTSFSKYAGNAQHTRYCVTFQAGKKKLSFYVSEFSYKGYRINESGTLKYKGSKIIDFS